MMVMRDRRTPAPASAGSTAAAPVAGGGGPLQQRLDALERELTALRAERDALAADRDRYLQLYEATPVACLTVDEAGCVVELNREAAELLGRSPEAVLGQALSSCATHGGETSIAAHLERCRRARAGTTIVGPAMLRTPTAGCRPVQLRTSIDPGEPSGERLFRCAVLDLTERQHQQAALREVEELLAMTVDAAQVGTWQLDVRTGRFVGSELALTLYGLPAGKPLDQSAVLARVLPEDRTHVATATRAAVQHGTPLRIAFRIAHPERGARWLAVRADSSRTPAGRRLLGLVQDITERKQAEQALRASERRAQERLLEITTIYNSAPVGLCIYDRRLRYVRINERMAEINGIPAAEHLGRTVREIVPDLADQAEQILHRVLATGEPVREYEMRGQTPAQPGAERVWIEHWLPLKDADGEVVAVNIVAEEVTRLKRSEAALRELTDDLERRVAQRTAVAERRAQSLSRLTTQLLDAEQRERKRLAAVLHDELQQLIYAARLNLETLQNSTAEESSARIAKVDQLLGESLHATRSLTSALNPPVLDEGGLPELLAWLRDWFGEQHGLNVDYTFIGEDAEIELAPAVRLLLFQGLRELLFNTVKHAGVDRARVECAVASDRLRLTIADEGAGFDPQSLEGDEAIGGFGLFSLRERTLALGGRLQIDSAPGHGSRFTFEVPWTPRSAAS